MFYLQLPEFKIEDVDFCFDKKQVYFTLVVGNSVVTCYMSAEEKIESFEVNIDSNPQNNIDRDFRYLVVSDTSVVVDQADIDICIVKGQTIGLTEKQRDDLNEILKEMLLWENLLMRKKLVCGTKKHRN